MTDAEGQALNRAIATKLGWKVTTATEKNGYGVEVTHWNLFDPEGHEVIDFENEPVWYGDYLGYAEDADAWAHAPDFAHSLDAVAAALPADADMKTEYIQQGGDYLWIVETDEWHGIGDGATRQEAAARALLAWLGAKGE